MDEAAQFPALCTYKLRSLLQTPVEEPTSILNIALLWFILTANSSYELKWKLQREKVQRRELKILVT